MQAWQDIVLEFDPYKYSSFSLNAAGQVQRLTSGMSREVAQSSREQGLLRDFPPVLAFISTVDSTVHVDAVVDALLEHRPADGHSSCCSISTATRAYSRCSSRIRDR